jgi:hypothetical protein
MFVQILCLAKTTCGSQIMLNYALGVTNHSAVARHFVPTRNAKRKDIILCLKIPNYEAPTTCVSDGGFGASSSSARTA